MAKKILYLMLGLLLLLLLIALIVPKSIKVNESIVIDAPKADVYSYVKDLQKVSESTVWQNYDPNVKKTFTGTQGEVGSTYRWESEVKDVGIGEQEILELKENELVVTQLRFEKPFESEDIATFYLEDTGTNQTTLIWDYESSKIPVPFNVMVTPFVTPKLTKEFKESLRNIKVAIEE